MASNAQIILYSWKRKSHVIGQTVVIFCRSAAIPKRSLLAGQHGHSGSVSSYHRR